MNSFISLFLLLLFRSLIDLDDWFGQIYINFLFYHCVFFTGYSTGNFCLSDYWHRLRPDLIRAFLSLSSVFIIIIFFSLVFLWELYHSNKTKCAALVNRELILDNIKTKIHIFISFVFLLYITRLDAAEWESYWDAWPGCWATFSRLFFFYVITAGKALRKKNCFSISFSSFISFSPSPISPFIDCRVLSFIGRVTLSFFLSVYYPYHFGGSYDP